MTLIEKKTWCPICHKSNIVRKEKIIRAGIYPKMFLIIYTCDTFDCYHETIIDIKVNKKIKKRIMKRERSVTDSTRSYELRSESSNLSAPTKK